ncbi:MAG TPA: ATP-binding protein [Planctomycetota bacterium]|nr:ATP-binding protein [Planctomycetota bacterium]
MATRSFWQLGIVGQALVWLVLGTMAVVGLAIWISYEATVSSNREDLLQNLTRWTQDRTARELAIIERVERQVRECRRLLQLRLQRPVDMPVAIPLLEDGSRRLIPVVGRPPVAVFINVKTSTDQRQVTAAMVARDLLAELAPTLAEYPSNLTIAVPTGWFAGWGPDQVDLARDILPIDPVMLPAEIAGLGTGRPVSWSEPFLEPVTERWQLTASTTLDSPETGRIAITQVLPIDELLKRATDRQASGDETVVYDRGGRLLATTTALTVAVRPGGDGTNVVPTLTTSGNPRLERLRSVIADNEVASELVIDPVGEGWYSVSRMTGPGWTEVTFHPFQYIDSRARTTAGWILIVGVAVMAAQALLLVTVLRSRVALPLARLSQAAADLTEDGGVIPTLHTYRQDEVDELSRRFVQMADAVAAREVELRQANTSLQEREELARALVDSAADAVVLFGDGVITEANPTAEELFRVGSQLLTGRNPIDLLAETSDGMAAAAMWNERIESALSGQTQHFPILMECCDGSVFEAEVGLARVDLPGSQRLLAVIRDVSQRNQLERQLRQGQKLESLGQLAGGIAHDFNNMLAGIMGAAELLERQVELAKRPRKLLGTILTTCERAAGLTRKLLSFARKGQPQRQPLDVHQVVHDTLGMLEASLDKRIELSASLSAERTGIIGDPADLQNALLNLAFNARDAMPTGGRLTFTTRLCDVGQAEVPGLITPLSPGLYLELSVNDTGSGIPASVLPRIFEPFFTTKAVGKGTGLGLAAVYGTVLDHGGSLRVDSQEGKGTSFVLYFPIAGEGSAITRAVQVVAHPNNQRGVVLLVDDEDLVRSVALAFLEEMGWEVIEAGDGQCALDLYRANQERIDIVMLDMEMPGRRGIDLLREMKQMNPGVIAILCSGYVRDGSVDQLIAEGFRAQLSKPYRMAELERVLEEVRPHPQ